ncbi:hypothetical protein DWX03_07825 [Coprococcus comes]|uniref:Uncharacterized protein n=1 Tax=Coprococcus comes TaxID=410072 RepID=A0A3R6IPE0_9FIRM|nr:hypothetical protein DWX03_07825 [Coprococcus comes]RHG62345.1 hypothetical protein DW252_02065 [Coprococcus comes]
MTVLEKKVFISSKPSIVCLMCPPPCGPFSIQESAVGGLSYKVKKDAESLPRPHIYLALSSLTFDTSLCAASCFTSSTPLASNASALY